ncbi:hypothetical protein [Neobacillus vireti]|uniref:DUF4190 domain-containing protein n=1 Tax=Neobacillus vireti LMG 21834 TaxID=1131730 RepID=A0AB94IP15_9BACI|nr:hypothetical protein [Neobacillus vireti]ETI68800.1 hypothetical protein BAVI_10482 [Neobacillus vireti LMG 21834]KLT19585.1 hypothetical protein AA980_03015 [Neobacillus vireti]
MSQNPGNKKDGSLKDFWLGLGISLGIYLLGILILFMNASIFFGYLCIAIIGLILFPIISFATKRNRLGQGALIGLGLNVLLFTACFGILITNFFGG